MLLRRWMPLDAFADFGREMERLVGDIVHETGGITSRSLGYPALNIREEGDALIVEAEVPGASMADIDVEVLGNELTIAGRRESVDDENAAYLRRERRVGEFRRVVTLPEEIDGDKVKAVLQNGVLTVTLPKAEAAKARRIEIKNLG